MNSQDAHQNCISALFFLDVSLSSFRFRDFGFYTSRPIFCVFYYVFNCSLYSVSWNCFACTFVTQLIKINQSINQDKKQTDQITPQIKSQHVLVSVCCRSTGVVGQNCILPECRQWIFRQSRRGVVYGRLFDQWHEGCSKFSRASGVSILVRLRSQIRCRMPARIYYVQWFQTCSKL